VRERRHLVAHHDDWHGREHQPPNCVVDTDADGGSVVTLHGEIDLYNAAELRGCLDELVASGETRVVIDLADLAFIDSSGLGALVGGMRRLRHAGGHLVLRHPRSETAKLLEVTGLQQVLTVER
jgi:anti-sigma B factor antagonist